MSNEQRKHINESELVDKIFLETTPLHQDLIEIITGYRYEPQIKWQLESVIKQFSDGYNNFNINTNIVTDGTYIWM